MPEPWFGAVVTLVGLSMLGLSVRPAIRYVRLLEHLPDRNDYRLPRISGFYHLDKIDGIDDLEAILSSVGDVRMVRYGTAPGRCFNPVTATQFVLSLVPYRDEALARRAMRVNLDHLLDSAERTPAGNLLFPYAFDWPWREEVAPWYSGMAQGQAASAFLWGYHILGDRRYSVAARAAVLAMVESRRVDFLVETAGGIWLKEYPSYRHRVLDGSLAGLAGIYDLWRFLGDEDPAKSTIASLLSDAVAGLKGSWHRFESATWGHFYSDLGSVGPAGKFAMTLAWLEYLSAYDPALLELRARLMARRRSHTANVLRVYGWAVHHFCARVRTSVWPSAPEQPASDSLWTRANDPEPSFARDTDSSTQWSTTDLDRDAPTRPRRRID